ncbi:MAG: hypothetical protein A2815_00575 [Candidatus Portnoybacteria bacterium RIFCSPHIGHO2_01_FULL_40_12b]|uniref:Uncharacterized protein n=2 Tax=Candidatus Portnoyibacteriota TaxID=1817913 RepID=A0A1G2FD22_9BACT|nr:MAG: hypothetical protein A2815_00575 [Candidatus Portnoybacteria bacterium RIFCSPHIGHO2_01_FULL_40_12b]OGZ40273.1 MAG: hypothetical protein A3I20_02065 [Candidatus Portnoybacteria bacterium RIFCSPLOWO2_02_FULL_40_15]
MKTKDTLYIKILVWAYGKQEDGFSWEDLKKEFQLSSTQEKWVVKVFRSNMPTSENLFDILSYSEKDNTHFYVITSKGTSAAIEYLNLQEAKRSAERAERIALWAIGIGIFVGVAQIIIGLFQLIYR